VVDGMFVLKESVISLHVERPSELVDAAIRAALPGVVTIIRRTQILRLIFAEGQVPSVLPETVGGQRARFVPFASARVDVLISDLKEVLRHLLTEELKHTTFDAPHIYPLKLILWVDAKYTYLEKSFGKVSLMGPPFKGHHTKLHRWADVVGHESAFLDPDTLSQLGVRTLFSFPLISC